ncbi:MAG: GyrI-like domain-containing protein, partial [Phycisphaerae bacterium]|nr:GyrI-like domain-containing protein [Phycisphaerae bacterium]
GVSYDDPEVTPPDKLRYDACIVVDDKVRASGDVGVQTIGGTRYAITTHKGPYECLSETYAALMGQWMPANGQEPGCGPCLEVYLNSPQNTPPEQLLTDVHVPLKDAP